MLFRIKTIGLSPFAARTDDRKAAMLSFLEFIGASITEFPLSG